MTMAEKRDDKDMKKGMELFNECLAAMLYSDEEIREVMSPDDAEEFIELRNNLVTSELPDDITIGRYENNKEEHLPLVAEEEETYE